VGYWDYDIVMIDGSTLTRALIDTRLELSGINLILILEKDDNTFAHLLITSSFHSTGDNQAA
jgi:hypothetical protein